MNISVSVLVLMLLWLIGGSPPVRSRNVSTFVSDQNPKRLNGFQDLSYNDDNTSLYNYRNEFTTKNNIMLSKRNYVIPSKSVEFDDNQNDCNERRSLLQIVIDTPNIYEVTVVSKSVAGKFIVLNNSKFNPNNTPRFLDFYYQCIFLI